MATALVNPPLFSCDVSLLASLTFWPAGSQWDQKRQFDASVEVKPDWELLESIDFSSLQKLSYEPVAPEDLMWCGELEFYDKEIDSITVRTERKLKRIERTFFKVTTTDDPVIRQLARDNVGNVFATDTILSTLMAAPRSVYSWDIVVQRVGSKLFLDKRDNSQFDYLTVNETSHDPPYDDKDSINSPFNLSQEATFINQNFSQQVLQREKKHTFDNPNPFASEDEDVASVAYRYRKWGMGDGIDLVARCEFDGVKSKRGENKYINIRALNEYDPKVTGVDWRQKLDSQRGAVLATELKNNSNKLAKWTAQAMLSGADSLVLGFVSRVNPKDSFRHVILGVQSYSPEEFANQIGLRQRQMWGILKALIDKCMALDEGKYIVLKDPNKQALGLYRIPPEAFEDEEEEDDEEEIDEGEDGGMGEDGEM